MARRLSFNLVIENLFFSRNNMTRSETAAILQFQSRNRESFLFKTQKPQPRGDEFVFQSRNRESFLFKVSRLHRPTTQKVRFYNVSIS